MAGLLLDRMTPGEWNLAIVERNLLQKRSRHTALSYAWLIRRRLETLSPELWTLVRDAPLPVATRAVFAATVKYSPLFGDFMQHILADQYRKFEARLRRQLWEHYIDECRNRDPAQEAEALAGANGAPKPG